MPDFAPSCKQISTITDDKYILINVTTTDEAVRFFSKNKLLLVIQ